MLKTLDKYFEISSDQKDLLKNYVFHVKKKQEKINFIGKSTLNKIWIRHVMDSMQIIKYLPIEKKGKYLVDVGTGAGFPGVVLFIMGRKDVLLCDKSSKKVSYLKEILEECSLNIKVYNCRMQIQRLYIKNLEAFKSRSVNTV